MLEIITRHVFKICALIAQLWVQSSNQSVSLLHSKGPESNFPEWIGAFFSNHKKWWNLRIGILMQIMPPLHDRCEVVMDCYGKLLVVSLPLRPPHSWCPLVDFILIGCGHFRCLSFYARYCVCFGQTVTLGTNSICMHLRLFHAFAWKWQTKSSELGRAKFRDGKTHGTIYLSQSNVEKKSNRKIKMWKWFASFLNKQI